MALPLRLEGHASACITTLQVIRRFEFESQLLRSGVLAMDSVGSADEAILFVRGAPASIEQLMGTNQVPVDYQQACSTLQAWDWWHSMTCLTEAMNLSAQSMALDVLILRLFPLIKGS